MPGAGGALRHPPARPFTGSEDHRTRWNIAITGPEGIAMELTTIASIATGPGRGASPPQRHGEEVALADDGFG